MKFNRLKNASKVIGFVLVTASMTACTTTGNYWGTDVAFGAGNADFFYVGSGYNAWDRSYYYDRGVRYGDFHPTYYYHHYNHGRGRR